MPVLGALSLTLEVPELEPGLRFYTDAGLEAASDGQIVRLRCPARERDSVILIGVATRKRLHHIALRADRLDEMAGGLMDFCRQGRLPVERLVTRFPFAEINDAVRASLDGRVVKPVLEMV